MKFKVCDKTWVTGLSERHDNFNDKVLEIIITKVEKNWIYIDA